MPYTLYRFVVRLLMVHGSLSVYRLSRLIKYSFYKNIAFAFLLLFYQIYCGFSGAALCPLSRIRVCARRTGLLIGTGQVLVKVHFARV